MFDVKGKFLRSFGSQGSLPAEFQSPKSLCIDQYGHLFVCDVGNCRVQVFNTQQRDDFVTSFGSQGDGPGQFHTPMSVCVARDRRIFVTDVRRGFVSVFGFAVNV